VSLDRISLEVARLRDGWPDEFRNGARLGFLGRADDEREAGGYPVGFHAWPLDRRNAWFVGFNRGRLDRSHVTRQAA
jgi:hypothetical protein